MNKIILLGALLALIAGSAYAAGTISWVRVYTPTIGDYRVLVSDSSLDIATARTGEYVELLIDADGLANLENDGYTYEYRMYDIYDPANYIGKGYSGYTNYDEMEDRMDDIVDDYPDIVVRTNEGSGRQGTHDIFLLKISDNVSQSEPGEEKLLITGVHHAREPMSLEVPLYFVEQLCADYATDPDVQDIVNGLELYVIPLTNPEGYNFDDVESSRHYWRKNSYNWSNPNYPDWEYYGNGPGVDLNRNYSYEWGGGGSSSNPDDPTYRGPSALSEPENQIVADLATDIGFISAMSYHQHGELILRPWGYTSQSPPSDDLAIMDDIGNGYRDTLHDELGRWYTYQSGNDLYPTNGDFVDYMYGEHGCIPFTIEMNDEFYPDENQIAPTCSAHYEAMKWWCLYILDNFSDADDENGNPNNPSAFALEAAYPNPAGSSTTFAFALPETAHVSLDIYDIKGRKVLNVLNETIESGEKEISTDLSSLSGGVYVYRLNAGEYSAAKKLVINK